MPSSVTAAYPPGPTGEGQMLSELSDRWQTHIHWQEVTHPSPQRSPGSTKLTDAGFFIATDRRHLMQLYQTSIPTLLDPLQALSAEGPSN